MLPNHLIFCSSLLLLPSIIPSTSVFPMSQLFPSGGQSIGSFSFNISPFKEYSGLITFKIDWFDLLAVQGMFKSLLQHHSNKASIHWHSAFLMTQLSHPYMTAGKTIALTIQTFVGKIISLLFNTTSRFVIAFLPSSRHLLISRLQSPYALILEPKKIVCHYFHFSPICLPWWDMLSIFFFFFEYWVVSQLLTVLFHFHQEAL